MISVLNLQTRVNSWPSSSLIVPWRSSLGGAEPRSEPWTLLQLPTQVPTELWRTLLSYAAPYWVMPHPTETCRTLLRHGAPYWATPHPPGSSITTRIYKEVIMILSCPSGTASTCFIFSLLSLLPILIYRQLLLYINFAKLPCVEPSNSRPTMNGSSHEMNMFLKIYAHGCQNVLLKKIALHMVKRSCSNQHNGSGGSVILIYRYGSTSGSLLLIRDSKKCQKKGAIFLWNLMTFLTTFFFLWPHKYPGRIRFQP